MESMSDTLGRTRMRGFYGNQQKAPLHIPKPDENRLMIHSNSILNHLDKWVNSVNFSIDAAVQLRPCLLSQYEDDPRYRRQNRSSPFHLSVDLKKKPIGGKWGSA